MDYDVWVERVIAIIFIILSLCVGYALGWDERVKYEAQQCADFGRCFH
jgi:hypothetical protein